jgi:hypothetical protein
MAFPSPTAISDFARWTGLALLGALGCTSCIAAQAEVSDMEVVHYGLAFEGTPRTPAGQASSVKSSFTHSHEPLDIPGDVRGEIRATEVTLAAQPGTPNLTFVERLVVTMLADGSKQAKPTVVLDYRRQPGAVPARDLVIPVHDTANSVDQWRTHASTYEVTVWGELPADPWSVNITVNFSGQFDYDYRI